jgi:hypothetical protein
MSTTIKLRRSAVPGRVPTTSQLELGEIAINTADGKLYYKRYDPVSNTESIIDTSTNLDADAILSLLSGVDGANSGLDADLLDGQEGTYYLDFTNFTNLPDPVLNVTGDVVGNTTFTDLGNASLVLELTDTGVTANTYGSASEVPVLTIDVDGRITAASTVSVAGVSNTYWTTATNTYTIETADGGVFNTVISAFNDISANNIVTTGLVNGRDMVADGAKLDLLEDGLDLTLTGKVTGTAFSNTGVMTLVTELANTGVTAGSYGSSTAIPVITVDEDGRITLANTAPVSGVENLTWTSANNTLTLETGDGTIYNIVLDEFNDITTNDITANNIIVSGLIDGRDIAADGAKLDRIEEDLTVTLTGKVTGTVTSNTGTMSVVTELANTGVIAGVYGSSTAIPVFTVDEDGRLTTANTTPVAGVDSFTYAAANNTITLATGDGSIFNIRTETEVTLSGKVTGSATSNDGNVLITTELANTGVTPGTYGSASAIPIITVDEDGRITVANTSAVAGVDDFFWVTSNNSLVLQTGDGTTYVVPIEAFNDISANNITVAGLVDGRDIAADGAKLDRLEEDLTVTLEGKVTGTITSNTGTMTVQTELANTGVVAGTYGSATTIPVLTIDEDGRITLANTANLASGVDDLNWISSNNSLILSISDGTKYIVPIDTFTDITVNDITANNIIVDGLVDGRDVAADGSKLDGIEAGATADQTASEILTLLLTVDGDGSGLDADFIDGYSASEILAAAANNAAALVGDGEVFIYANTGVTVTGDSNFNLNSANTFVIEIAHSDTSSVANTSLSLPNVITGLTFDTFGHVQTVSSSDLDTRYYTETELNNGQLDNRYYTETEIDANFYTKTQLDNGQLDNRYYTETELDNGQLDNRYYTETELDNGQLDNRYYTETEADNRFVNVTGDTMSGELIVNANISQSHSTFISSTSTTTTTSQTTIYAFPIAAYVGAEIIINASQSSDRHITKLLITHDGTTAIATEYGTVFTGSQLASYDITISGPVLQILATPSTINSTTFKIVGTLIKV